MKPESKREEFRRYLEKAGVMDALTRVLVGLYEEPERPSNAIEYFRDRLGAGVPLKSEVNNLQTEVTDLTKKIQDLEDEISRLRQRLGSVNGSHSQGSAAPGGGRRSRGVSLELEEDPTTWSEAEAGVNDQE